MFDEFFDAFLKKIRLQKQYYRWNSQFNNFLRRHFPALYVARFSDLVFFALPLIALSLGALWAANLIIQNIFSFAVYLNLLPFEQAYEMARITKAVLSFFLVFSGFAVAFGLGNRIRRAAKWQEGSIIDYNTKCVQMGAPFLIYLLMGAVVSAPFILEKLAFDALDTSVLRYHVWIYLYATLYNGIALRFSLFEYNGRSPLGNIQNAITINAVMLPLIIVGLYRTNDSVGILCLAFASLALAFQLWVFLDSWKITSAQLEVCRSEARQQNKWINLAFIGPLVGSIIGIAFAVSSDVGLEECVAQRDVLSKALFPEYQCAKITNSYLMMPLLSMLFTILIMPVVMHLGRKIINFPVRGLRVDI